MAPGNNPERFSLVAGGLFHGTLRRLGALGADALPTSRAAAALALLAWSPPALLAVAQTLVQGVPTALEFFADATAHTRYLAAVWVMIATERYADERLVLLTRQFTAARIVRDESLPAFEAALADADRRSGSGLSEGLMLAAALAWSSLSVLRVASIGGATWEGSLIDGRVVLSWAGHVARWVSTPLFAFLVLRWIWRFFVWAALLFRISRLSLQLAPLHADRSAGLGFLSLYPGIFSGFVFALSCVIASVLTRALLLAPRSPDTVWLALAAWLVFVLIVFLGPLLVFVRPLFLARERALLDYGRLSHQHHLAFQDKWIGGAQRGAELLGSADPSSTSDLNASVDVVRGMRIVPVDASAVVQLLLAAGIPLLAVVATQVPLVEVMTWIVGAIL